MAGSVTRWQKEWLSLLIVSHPHTCKSAHLLFAIQRNWGMYSIAVVGRGYDRKLLFSTLWFHLKFINNHSHESTAHPNLLTCYGGKTFLTIGKQRINHITKLPIRLFHVTHGFIQSPGNIYVEKLDGNTAIETVSMKGVIMYWIQWNGNSQVLEHRIINFNQTRCKFRGTYQACGRHNLFRFVT
jgi:hypothetical protein